MPFKTRAHSQWPLSLSFLIFEMRIMILCHQVVLGITRDGHKTISIVASPLMEGLRASTRTLGRLSCALGVRQYLLVYKHMRVGKGGKQVINTHKTCGSFMLLKAQLLNGLLFQDDFLFIYSYRYKYKLYKKMIFPDSCWVISNYSVISSPEGTQMASLCSL